MATANKKTAAEERSKALGGRDESFVEALKVERQGYVTRGLKDRVAQVDEQIALYGGKVPATRGRAGAAGKTDTAKADDADKANAGDADNPDDADKPGDSDKPEA